MQLKVSGKGNAAPFGGVNGDLLVLISVEEHPVLIRDSNNNLHFDKYISFSEAVLGTSIEIPTVNGKVKIKLEAGTQSGKTLRLKGKGIPSVDGYAQGDLMVHINLFVIKKLIHYLILLKYILVTRKDLIIFVFLKADLILM